MLVLMKRFQNGFTIVEILVVVGTLGILVTIGLVGWGQMVNGHKTTPAKASSQAGQIH